MYPIPKNSSYVSYSQKFKLCILFPQFQAMYPIPTISSYVSFSHNFKLCILFPQFQAMYPILTISNYVSHSNNFKLCILFTQFQAMYSIPTISMYFDVISCDPSLKELHIEFTSVPIESLLRYLRFLYLCEFNFLYWSFLHKSTLLLFE